MGGRGGTRSGRSVGRPRKTQSTGGITYTRSDSSVRQSDALITVRVDKLDKGWKLDDGYIGPGGAGEIKGRRKRFSEFLKTGKPIEAPEVTVTKSGQVIFTNGRHRTSVLRDRGQKTIVIAVPKGQAERIRRQLN